MVYFFKKRFANLYYGNSYTCDQTFHILALYDFCWSTVNLICVLN
jgi:hypothetical protein